MTIGGIDIHCDTPSCGAVGHITATTPEQARRRAHNRYGWTHTAGLDHCRTCTTQRTPDTHPLVAENFPTNDATRRTDQKPV
ncbi:hypothetical protein ACQPYK_25320 [Streptosporangium sp. CA-135522]|uniref:hypothetical protein n=1 Tax=Streptosporangium sp. CA-135522 TaxID=3240072 RepID=UPI003D8F3CDB